MRFAVAISLSLASIAALVSGQTLGDAVSAVRVSPAALREWFKTWVANRVFREIG